MVTLAEVAQRAQVTAATVSNVLRNPQKVKPTTVERVMAAVRELGYRPNLTARALAEGRTSTLALMLSNISNPFYPEFVLEAETAARRRGYFLLVCNTDDDPAIARAYLDKIAGTLAAGVIVMNTDVSAEELAEVAQRGSPLVLCMWEGEKSTRALPCVTADYTHAGELAAAHLHELGHRRIGALLGEGSGGPQSSRLHGFIEALVTRGVSAETIAVQACRDSIEAGYDAARALLESQPKLTALFATNDLMAIGAIQAANDMGKRVPQDLSVIGLTNIHLAHQFRPALTTVAFPTAAIASIAVSLTLDRIEGIKPKRDAYKVPLSELVVRDTTAPVPKASRRR
ncbi:LacI family DNA-binding transcriptional regulator [Paraburkholderia sp. DHOC27]|uniref:LacI family DNA-binding transcriptional regulator n=1 Tax=Paraburkholderia sp. DHOC27 TaxID=2303330 RepID=UPI000E3CF753|nr:LacI family DNA-binding transcriptional regulator [Paraburkholderia sp. DHOC27]RFU45180.1 LacI family transcriptional regulator [Paraburkholderia sp. DHOC27]